MLGLIKWEFIGKGEIVIIKTKVMLDRIIAHRGFLRLKGRTDFDL